MQRVGQIFAGHDGIGIVGLDDEQVGDRRESEIDGQIRVRIGIAVRRRFAADGQRDRGRDDA